MRLEKESIDIDSALAHPRLESLPDSQEGGKFQRKNYNYSGESDFENSPSQSGSSSSSSSSSSTGNPPNPLSLPELVNSTGAPIIANQRQVPITHIIIDVPVRTPQYNMEQVSSAFKQSTTGGLNLPVS